MVFLKEYFKKLILKKADDNNSRKNYPACKELNFMGYQTDIVYHEVTAYQGLYCLHLGSQKCDL